MKRSFVMLLVTAALFTLTACSGSAQHSPAPSPGQSTAIPGVSTPITSPAPGQDAPTGGGAVLTPQPSEDVPARGGNVLIAFFSRAGENYRVGVIEKGNTHIIAEMIAGQTGGTLFQIQTVTPYPESYADCTQVAQQEQRENARPELSAAVENMADYDVIFLGYPNWWGDMPMAVYTFLESYDFTGKTLIPFATHEGSGLSNTERSIAAACPGATVLRGLAIRGSTAQNEQNVAREAVESWLIGLELP